MAGRRNVISGVHWFYRYYRKVPYFPAHSDPCCVFTGLYAGATNSAFYCSVRRRLAVQDNPTGQPCMTAQFYPVCGMHALLLNRELNSNDNLVLYAVNIDNYCQTQYNKDIFYSMGEIRNMRRMLYGIFLKSTVPVPADAKGNKGR